MKTTQAWGWLTAGVLALGLNGFYQDGGAAWAHRILDHAVGRIEARVQPVLAVALAMAQPDRIVARTETAAMPASFVQQEPAVSCRLGSAMARVQNKLVRTQTRFADLEKISARHEVALARMEANRERMEAHLDRLQFTPAMFVTNDFSAASCPRTHQHSTR